MNRIYCIAILAFSCLAGIGTKSLASDKVSENAKLLGNRDTFVQCYNTITTSTNPKDEVMYCGSCTKLPGKPVYIWEWAYCLYGESGTIGGDN